VVIRAHPGKTPFTDPQLARAVVAQIEWLGSKHGVSIYAYCLMLDHLHVLLGLGDSGPIAWHTNPTGSACTRLFRGNSSRRDADRSSP
jgi:hypothetical protein